MPPGASGTSASTDPGDASRSHSRERWLGVELRHLAALDAVVREGSFRGAADTLGYVQSAISQQVSHLEDLVGTRLVERSRGSASIALTDAGSVLREHVETILAKFQAAQDELAALARGRAGTLRVGTFHSVAARLFPHLLPAFARSAPDVQVVPVERQTDLPLFALVEEGEVDVAFCQLPLVDGPFASVELMEDPFVLLVSSRSPLAAREDPPSLAELGDLPLIGFNRSRAQDQVLAVLREHGVDPEIGYRSDLNATVQALVASDLGVAVAPFLSVNPQHPGTTVVELPDLPPRRLALFWHADRKPRPVAAAFTEAVRATCARRFRHERSGRAGDAVEPPVV